MQLNIIKDQTTSLYGLENSKGLKVLESNWISIRKIKNYTNLSFQEFTDIYLLSKNADSNYEYFAYLNNEKIVVSDKEYMFTEFSKCESHFYKNLTICKIIESQEIIIDLNENIIGGPYDVEPNKVYKLTDSGKSEEVANFTIGGGWFECDCGYNINNNEYKSIVAELCRSYDSLSSYYGYGLESHLSFYEERDLDFCYLTPDVWTIDTEYELGFEYSATRSLYYTKIEKFNLENGIALVEDYGKYKFINKFYKEVGESFEHIISEELTLKYLVKNSIYDQSCYYIQKDNKVHKIKFTGDYVKEVCLNPTIFVENENLKSFLKSIRFVDDTYQISQNTIISKIDSEFIKDMIINEKIINNEFIQTEDWVNSIYNDVILKEDYIEKNFPFVIDKSENLNSLSEKINKFNKLFGVAYSGYEIIETYDINLENKQI